MKDMGEATYVLGIKIDRDRSRGFLGLSQKAYVDQVLKRYDMAHCKPGESPVIKGELFESHNLKMKFQQKYSRSMHLQLGALCMQWLHYVCNGLLET